MPSYMERRVLTHDELCFLRELLWFTANLTADSEEKAFEFLERGLANSLFLVVKEYAEQFSNELWRLFVWNFHALSLGLHSQMDDLEFKVDPFECFVN